MSSPDWSWYALRAADFTDDDDIQLDGFPSGIYVPVTHMETWDGEHANPDAPITILAFVRLGPCSLLVDTKGDLALADFQIALPNSDLHTLVPQFSWLALKAPDGLDDDHPLSMEECVPLSAFLRRFATRLQKSAYLETRHASVAHKSINKLKWLWDWELEPEDPIDPGRKWSTGRQVRVTHSHLHFIA
jgi:hypothetical protein